MVSTSGPLSLGDIEALPCPAHATCPGGLSMPVPSRGHWINRERPSEASILYRCTRATCIPAPRNVSFAADCWLVDPAGSSFSWRHACNADQLLCSKGAGFFRLAILFNRTDPRICNRRWSVVWILSVYVSIQPGNAGRV